MSIEVTIFADASPRAVAAFRGLREFDGERFLFPYRTPGVVTPPMGLLAARDVAGRCLDHAASFGEVDAPQPRLGVEAPAHPGLPEGVWDRQRGGRVTEWRVGPDPWRVLANEPTGSPVSRIIAHLELRGRGSLPIGELRAMRKYSL